MIIRALCVLLLCLTTQVVMAADAPPRVISVSGVGEVHVAPDRATVRLGVESRQLILNDARREVNKVVGAFLDYCKELGIADQAISTSGATIRPEYSWANEVRNLTGYFVARNLMVDLEELEKLGRLMEGAVDLGVNQVSEPVFGLTDQGRYQREAMTLAAEDARRNGATLAEALNVAVGPVININALADSPSPPQPMMISMNSVATESRSGAESYRSGEISFRVRVEATFAIADDNS